MNDITNHEKSSSINKNHHQNPSNIINWLVVWNMNFIFPYIGNNNPNWLCHIFQRGRSTIKHHQTSSNIIKHDRPVRYAEVNATIFRDTEEGMLLQMLFAAWPKTADFEPTFHRRWGKARCYNSPWGYNCSNKLGKIPSICGDGAKSLICMSWMVECHGMVICMACFGCGTEEMTGMVWQHVLCPPQHRHQPTPSGDRNDRTVNNKINALRRCMSCYLVIYGIILPID